jgi:hypothetical protein
MRKKIPMAMILCVALAPGFTGCTHKDAVSKNLEKAAKEMEKASPDQPAAPVAAQPSPATPSPQAAPAPAPTTQPPPAQQMNQALASYKSGDYEDAVTRLQKLRATRAISTEQRMALQDAMASVMADIYSRAARGDARAKLAVKQYEQMQTAPEAR